MMRMSNVAIYTLATLVAGVMSAEAIPSKNPHAAPQEQASKINSPLIEAIEPDPEVAQTLAQTENLAEITTSAQPSIASPVAEDTNKNQPVPVELILTQTAGAEALRANDFVSQSSITDANQQLRNSAPQNQANTCASSTTPNSGSTNLSPQDRVAQAARNCPRPTKIEPLTVPKIEDAEFESSPGLSIYIPVGYGADRNTFWVSGTYQNTTRADDDDNNGALGVGVGLGDADRLVGLELSYAFANFNDEDNIGEGGFNAKVHRRFGDSLSVAAGYNGLVNIGGNDFEHSRYGVITKIFRLRESIRDPLSRLSVTVGVGDGQFRSNGAVDAGDNDPNIFGNVAIRAIRPVSFITEWTGQDLALGLSIAPFKNIPWVITPAVRDLAGRGDDPRFVLGSGFSFQF